MTDPWKMSVRDLASAYRAGDLSPIEAMASCRDRIESIDQYVSAFTFCAFDEAERDARAATKRAKAGTLLGPLDGIPVAVKELFEVAGWPNTGGSRVFANRVGKDDAAAVKRLRQSGAVVLGLTRSHEFAWGITTQHPELGGTRNPWNLQRIPGGSSGGSAASVAAGMAPLTVGSDTGGSVRIPAAFCGTVGFKPSFGSIDVQGLLPLAPSLDHVGVFARDVLDAEAAIDVLDDTKSGDHIRVPLPDDLRGVKLAVAGREIGPPPVLGYARAFDDAVTAFEAEGAKLTSIELPDGNTVTEMFGSIQRAEARSVHSTILKTYPARQELYGVGVRARVEKAGEVTLADYMHATRARIALIHDLRRSLKDVDVLLSPAAACGPSHVSTPDSVHLAADSIPLRDAVMPYTMLQNIAGLPAIVIPFGFGDDRLPVAVQLTGSAGTDRLVMRVAELLYRVSPSSAGSWPPIENEHRPRAAWS